jgi:hypothetical protein
MSRRSNSPTRSKPREFSPSSSPSREEKKMEIEKIPPVLLARIGEFLSYKERRPMSLTSPTLWRSNKEVPIDLTSFGFNYTNLIKFLNANKDLNIIGIGVRLEHSDTDLSALTPWMKHLKKLTITRTDYTDRTIRDFSFLSEAVNLEYFNTNIMGEVLPYLENSSKLKKLIFVGSEEQKFRPVFENLEYLSVYYGTETTLNLKGCPSLTRLNINQSRFTSVKLDSNNILARFTLNNLANIDFSFLTKCDNLHRLSVTVNGGNLNLDDIDGKHLHILSLEGISKLRGDFTRFSSLKYLRLNNITDLPDMASMPATLKYLSVKISPDQAEFNMESLSVCTNLEKLYIKNGNGIVDVSNIAHCKSLRHVFIHTGEIINSRKLSKLPLLTTLVLVSNNTSSMDAKLSKCPLLRSVILRIRLLTDVNCIQDCKNLEYLDITSDQEVSVQAIATCPKLEAIVLYSSLVRDHTPFLPLQNLRELYIFNNGIRPRYNKELEDKLIPWNNFYIRPLREKNEAVFNVKIDDDVMDRPE